MKPITYDFDVITDAPAPKRRAPEPAEQPPQADAERERRRVAETLAREPRSNAQAAE
ncbi:MAG TPA: hypothetical protein VJV39_25730 [Dongiaceae bacterium]|nr:hypothetical protein [Dongiaceae bacterium]